MEKKKNLARRAIESQHRPKAATCDVVSPPPKPVKVDPKWKSHYRHLTDLRNHFLRQSGMLAQDALEDNPSFSEHMADAGTDSYDRDFALSMLSSDQSALFEIDHALRRIEDGTYGICEVTGKLISRSRLAAIPWARFTVEAEAQMEQRGAVNRAKLGNLGSVAETAPADEETPEKESTENAGEENNH